MSADSWIAGFHAVMAALQSDRVVEVVWIQEGRRDKRATQVFAAARRKQVKALSRPARDLDEVAGGVPHNGCVARVAPVRYRQLSDVMTPAESPGRLLLLDSMDDPRNLGAIVRSAVAFGVDAVIVAGPGAPALGGAGEKAAAGLLNEIPLVRANVAGDTLRILAEAGYWILGADASGADLRRITAVSRWVLCLGSEEKGLRAKTRHRIDEWISIPMEASVESLNVSVAAGVLLYELCRRWETESANGRLFGRSGDANVS